MNQFKYPNGLTLDGGEFRASWATIRELGLEDTAKLLDEWNGKYKEWAEFTRTVTIGG